MRPPPPPSGRPAEWADLPGLRRLLAAAYASDPLVVWIFPDETTRDDAVASWLGLFLEQSLASANADLVERDGQVVALAAWRTSAAASAPSGAPSIGGLLAALIGAPRASVVGDALSDLRAHAATTPSDYLQLLAVHPDHQGRGLGRTALRPGLARATAAGLDTHLETANPRAVDFYRSLGFRSTGTLDLASGGPHLWVLHRDAG